MKRITLGNTGIKASRLGIGTGSEHPEGGTVQSRMGVDELAGLLLHAFQRGINLWDTAYQYHTYPHVGKALKQIRREDVVLVTKIISNTYKEAQRDMEDSLKAVGTDYFDVCLLHGLRTSKEFERRAGALEALVRLKDQGKVRSVGFSSHGMSALRHGLGLDEIDLVWARINHTGMCMDSSRLGMYDTLASIPALKKVARMLPAKVISLVHARSQMRPVHEDDRREVEDILRRYHSNSKGVVCMKVLANGRLAGDKERAIGYIKNLEFVDAFVIGMLNREELDENCRLAGLV